jgi:hypothetical protein
MTAVAEATALEADAAEHPDRTGEILLDERTEARRRWPEEYDATDEEYYPAAESRWRGLAEAGVPRIVLVPGTVADLCEFAARVGGSPTDSEVKVSYSRSVTAEHTLAWPPPRNSACWCGSASKYKKCCGRSNLGD